MKYKELELYLELFNDYLESCNVYSYQIINMSVYTNHVVFSYVEISPCGLKSSVSMLCFSIDCLNNLTIMNQYGRNCIYDYLEEIGMIKAEADAEIQKYKEKIINYKEKYCL